MDMKKLIGKAIKFIKKNYKSIIALIVLLFASIMIYYFVSAEGDDFADKLSIDNATVSIKDGTAPFDSDSSAGNDSSDNNKIVRNFDSIEYSVKFNLKFKDSETTGSPTGRSVTADIELPKDLDVVVSSGLDSENTATPVISGSNAHYQLEYKNINFVGDNTIQIYISKINSTNGTSIKPKIKIKETTDTTSFDSLTDLNPDIVTVSAIDRLSIKLYGGTMKKNGRNTTIPVGMLLYIPNEGEKGILGASVPSSWNANLSITKDNDSTISFIESGNYNKDKYTVTNLPNSYSTTNGNLGQDGSGENYTLKFTNLKYNSNVVNLNEGVDGAEENNVTYISSKVFVVNSSKNTNKDVTLNYKITKDSKTIESINIVDNYEPFVGKYSSKIDFINESNITTNLDEDINYEESGKAIYNYGENFYIQDTLTYSTGDTLDNGLDNYIKIDNDIMKIIDVGNLSDETKDYFISMSSSNEEQNVKNPNYSVKYGVGTWASNNFKVKSDAPSYCPKSLGNLTKDQLMNYYGGPCIEENTDAVKWYESINKIPENDQDNIILFKFEFGDKYYPGTTTTIRLRGQIKKDINLIDKTAQIVSRGTTIFKNETYYLSEEEANSVSNQSADLKYEKTVYNTSTKEIDKIDNPSGKYGNTILVSPFSAQFSSVVIKDSNDSEKQNIYSGINDPISINITPVLYKSDLDASFTSAKVVVYLPIELELTIEKGDRQPVSNNLTKDGLYRELVYDYAEDEIKYGDQGGVIPKLVVHAYIDISLSKEKNVSIKTVLDATLRTNNEPVKDFSSNAPISTRTNTKDIVLYNTKTIGTLGKVTPTYFEKNQAMNYNMRVSNVSGTDANLELIKVLPYNGDSVNEGSDFDGSISVKLAENLPTGYSVYYTKDDSKTIINNALSQSSKNNWVRWDNYTTSMNGITAIKIATDAKTVVKNSQYFASKNGINLIMSTFENKDGDEYYNNFYVIYHHTVNCDTGIDGGCPSTAQDKVPYASNVSYSSVYNRQVSGFVFEDYDYDGLYSTGEKKLKDVVAELYKLSNTNFDKTKPLEAISSSDEKIQDTVTDKNGVYKFKGLQAGNYYVKYTFNCEKYTVTQKNKTSAALGDTTALDSDADMVSGTCAAVSNIVTVDNSNVIQNDINLGLRIRQNFDVNIKKYITNVTINSNRGKQSYDYNNETKVKIDVKNLKNTTFRVTYKFQIENSKYFPGTIGTIIETIPNGMTFDPSLPENDGWYESGGYLYYSNFDKTYILPDEKYYMTIVLDLKTDSGGDFVNFVAVQDLKIAETTANLLEGVQITDYNPALDKPIE